MEVHYREEGVAEAASSVAGRLVADGVPARLAAGDPTLWDEDAEGETEGGRPFRVPRELLAELDAVSARLRAAVEPGGEGPHVVLIATGCAALAAEAICDTADVPLTVLDTADPGQVRRALADRPESTVVVAAADTAEGDACLRLYEELFERAGLAPAGRVVAVANPGTPLAEHARERGYAVVPAGEGGALSAAALLPAALAGADVARLLDDAEEVAPLLSRDVGNPGLDLGAALGGAALAGRDKLLLEDRLSPIAGLPDWVEALVTAATGKQGRGILPVVGADPLPAADELVVGLDTDLGDVRVDGRLGAQFLVWEYATAVAALLLGVDPDDRPETAEQERQAAALLTLPDLPTGALALTDGPVEVYGATGAKDLRGLFAELLHAVPPDGYLAVTAYLDRLAAFDAPVLEGADFEQMTDAWMMADPATLRALLALRTDRPVTFGWGPRYLHGAGQYHKGGPRNGVFLQITGAVADEVAVPGRSRTTLGRLQLAQALGDLEALETRGRPAVRLHLTDRAAGVAHLLAAAQEV
ncbi:glucose-6-phosphate isomerase [Nonomuraea bangladeshensis]|uniref:glucose-6-phosphate isomerase n=1 Tax=Nonomuraea bangladeshensis TaxID=404385 RepID=UPI003C3079AA